MVSKPAVHGGESAEDPVQVVGTQQAIPGEHGASQFAHHGDEQPVDPAGAEECVPDAGREVVEHSRLPQPSFAPRRLAAEGEGDVVVGRDGLDDDASSVVENASFERRAGTTVVAVERDTVIHAGEERADVVRSGHGRTMGASASCWAIVAASQ